MRENISYGWSRSQGEGIFSYSVVFTGLAYADIKKVAIRNSNRSEPEKMDFLQNRQKTETSSKGPPLLPQSSIAYNGKNITIISNV